MELTLCSVSNFKEIDVSIYLIAVSLAVQQRVTVIKGQTLSLTCPLTNAHKTNVDWKNPEGYIMFFNAERGEGDILCASIAQHMYNSNTHCQMFGQKNCKNL